MKLMMIIRMNKLEPQKLIIFVCEKEIDIKFYGWNLQRSLMHHRTNCEIDLKDFEPISQDVVRIGRDRRITRAGASWTSILLGLKSENDSFFALLVLFRQFEIGLQTTSSLHRTDDQTLAKIFISFLVFPDNAEPDNLETYGNFSPPVGALAHNAPCSIHAYIHYLLLSLPISGYQTKALLWLSN